VRKADVLHLAGPVLLPIVLGLIFRKPVVVEHHGFQAICPNGQLFHEPTQTHCPGHFMAGTHMKCIECNVRSGWFQTLKLWVLTFPRHGLCRWVAVNVAPTEWLARLLQLKHTTVIYHGLPSEHASELSPVPSHVLTFAYVGRLVSTKGVQTLLIATKLLRTEGFSLKIKIIGDGPERKRLEKAAADLGLNDVTEFMGHVSADRFEEEISNAATIVMPSLAGEVFGMVAAENMARGKLVICSDIGAIGEVVGDAGLSFPPGDASALAGCMRSVLESPELARRLGRKAHTRAAEFDAASMLRRHLDVYRDLAARSQ